jgi:NAD(P)H-dependent FMN reductase
MKNGQINILALSGSLRKNSSAAAVLEHFGSLMPPHISFKIFDGIGQIPHFDDSEEVPEAVIKFRQLLSEADGVLIVTPEYAFGVPGSLKNALDWTVSSGELVNKPMALVTASSHGEKGHAAMLLILQALSANVAPGTSLLISYVRSKLDAQNRVKDIPTLNAMETVVNSFIHAIHETGPAQV